MIVSYKPNNLTAVSNFLVVAAVMFVVAYIDTEQLWVSLRISAITAVALCAISYLSGRVTHIQINHQENTAEFITQTFFKQSIRKFSLKEITVTYKNEIGAKGTIAPSFKIYQFKKLLLRINPGINGWSDRVLKEITTQIQKVQQA